MKTCGHPLTRRLHLPLGRFCRGPSELRLRHGCRRSGTGGARGRQGSVAAGEVRATRARRSISNRQGGERCHGQEEMEEVVGRLQGYPVGGVHRQAVDEPPGDRQGPVNGQDSEREGACGDPARARRLWCPAGCPPGPLALAVAACAQVATPPGTVGRRGTAVKTSGHMCPEAFNESPRRRRTLAGPPPDYSERVSPDRPGKTHRSGIAGVRSWSA